MQDYHSGVHLSGMTVLKVQTSEAIDGNIFRENNGGHACMKCCPENISRAVDRKIEILPAHVTALSQWDSWILT
jgi:hypothetical protein